LKINYRSENITGRKQMPSYFIFISAILAMVSLTFFKLNFLVWFCETFIILYFMTNDISAKKAFKSFFLYGIAFNLTFLHWLFNLHPLTWMGYSMTGSFALVLLAWLSLSVFESLFYALIGYIAFLFKPKKAYTKGLLVIFTILLTEWSRGLGSLGFPWARLAISQYENILLIQGASLFGILFVSFIILVINFCLSVFVLSVIDRKIKRSVIFLAGAIFIFLANLAFGLSESKKNFGDLREINISIIQGNVAVEDKWTDPDGESVKEKHFRLTRYAVDIYPRTEFVFWAESAIPVNLTRHPDVLSEISSLSGETGKTLIVGAILYDENSGLRNAIISVDKNGIIDKYYKRHPVPVGEYIPLKNIVFKLFPRVKDSRIAGEGIAAGDSTSLIRIYDYKLGALVCYDSIFPDLAAASAKDGANILFVASNDSWYKNSVALRQHNAQSVFRAVETRKYIIRAANTGLSSIISEKGRILQISHANEEAVINGNVVLNNYVSFYVKSGHAFIYFIIGIFIFLVISPILSNQNKYGSIYRKTFRR
jgi:apolipoprotein N-acyltransferase